MRPEGWQEIVSYLVLEGFEVPQAAHRLAHDAATVDDEAGRTVELRPRHGLRDTVDRRHGMLGPVAETTRSSAESITAAPRTATKFSPSQI